jgi:hypothetical protein
MMTDMSTRVSNNTTGNVLVRVNVTLRIFGLTIVALEKEVCVKYSECACVSVTLFILHANIMGRIMRSSVVCPVLLCFTHIISQTARFF